MTAQCDTWLHVELVIEYLIAKAQGRPESELAILRKFSGLDLYPKVHRANYLAQCQRLADLEIANGKARAKQSYTVKQSAPRVAPAPRMPERPRDSPYGLLAHKKVPDVKDVKRKVASQLRLEELGLSTEMYRACSRALDVGYSLADNLQSCVYCGSAMEELDHSPALKAFDASSIGDKAPWVIVGSCLTCNRTLGEYRFGCLALRAARLVYLLSMPRKGARKRALAARITEHWRSRNTCECEDCQNVAAAHRFDGCQQDGRAREKLRSFVP